MIALLVTRQLLFTRLDRQIERDLAQEVEELRQLADGNDPQTGEPFNEDAAAIFDTFLEPQRAPRRRGVLHPRRRAAAPLQPRPARRSCSTTRPWSAALGRPRPSRCGSTCTTADAGEARTLAVPLRTADGDHRRVRRRRLPPRGPGRARTTRCGSSPPSAGLVLLLTGAAAWSLAGRVVRPVRELTATARRISESDRRRGSRSRATTSSPSWATRSTTCSIGSTPACAPSASSSTTSPTSCARRSPSPAGTSRCPAAAPEEHAETVALVTDELDRMGRYVRGPAAAGQGRAARVPAARPRRRR